jgi:hypothetical protein
MMGDSSDGTNVSYGMALSLGLVTFHGCVWFSLAVRLSTRSAIAKMDVPEQFYEE